MVCAGANDALAKSKNAQVRFIILIFGRLFCVVETLKIHGYSRPFYTVAHALLRAAFTLV